MVTLRAAALLWALPLTLGDKTEGDLRGSLPNILGRVCTTDSDCSAEEQCLTPLSGALSGLHRPNLLSGLSALSIKTCSPRILPPGYTPGQVHWEQMKHFVLPERSLRETTGLDHSTAEQHEEVPSETRQPESIINGALLTAKGLIGGVATIPGSLLAGHDMPDGPSIDCRAYQRQLYVGETISINATGFQNDLFNVTLGRGTNPDQVSIHIKELQTMSKVPGVFQFTCDTPGVFTLKFKVFATDAGGGILGRGISLCKPMISEIFCCMRSMQCTPFVGCVQRAPMPVPTSPPQALINAAFNLANLPPGALPPAAIAAQAGFGPFGPLGPFAGLNPLNQAAAAQALATSNGAMFLNPQLALANPQAAQALALRAATHGHHHHHPFLEDHTQGENYPSLMISADHLRPINGQSTGEVDDAESYGFDAAADESVPPVVDDELRAPLQELSEDLRADLMAEIESHLPSQRITEADMNYVTKSLSMRRGPSSHMDALASEIMSDTTFVPISTEKTRVDNILASNRPRPFQRGPPDLSRAFDDVEEEGALPSIFANRNPRYSRDAIPALDTPKRMPSGASPAAMSLPLQAAPEIITTEASPEIVCQDLSIDIKLNRPVSLSLPGTLFQVKSPASSAIPVTRVLIPGYEGDAKNFVYNCQSPGVHTKFAAILAESPVNPSLKDFKTCPLTINCRNNNAPKVECRQEVLTIKAPADETVTFDVTGPHNVLFSVQDSDGDNVISAVQDTKTAKVKFALTHSCAVDMEEGRLPERIRHDQYLITAFDGEDSKTVVCKVDYGKIV